MFRFLRPAESKRETQSPRVFGATQDRHPPARRGKTRASDAFDRRRSNGRREYRDQDRPELFGLMTADRSKRKAASCSLARPNFRAGLCFVAALTDSWRQRAIKHVHYARGQIRK